MNESTPSNNTDQLELFLDGLMNDQQRQQFVDAHPAPGQLTQTRDLQQQLDDRLRALFPAADDQSLAKYLPKDTVPPLETDQPSTPLTDLSNQRGATAETIKRLPSSWSTWMKWTIAASLLFTMGVVVWNTQFHSVAVTPHFETRALPELYRESVSRGFKPYYQCDDLERFANIFDKRLNVSLSLAESSPDREMLGLSYIGGLSRETIAVLCKSKSQPVMVFVDIDDHAIDASEFHSQDKELNVFSWKRFGLVFYEVTPLSESAMENFFVLSGDAPTPLK